METLPCEADGMLSIDSNQVKGMLRYPTREYEGLEIVLNLSELEKQIRIRALQISQNR